MVDEKGIRQLAYVDIVHDIQPIEGADNIETIHVEGWRLIAKKGEFKEGDKCVFFEIDSKLPKMDPRFGFMEKKGYKVKTMKLTKFGAWSEGLALPLSEFPEIPQDSPVHTFVTKQLGVTYYDPEDQARKRDINQDAINSYKKQHKKFFSNKLVQFLMKFKFWRKVFLYKLYHKKNRSNLPYFIHPSDEERIQNCTFYLKDKSKKWVVTEKLDGTNTTIAVERKPFGKFEVYVCSRNRTLTRESECYQGNENIYFEMCDKYHIADFLIDYLKQHRDLKWAYVKGESIGPKWQGNPLKCEENDFRAFDFADNINGRYGSLESKELLAKYGIPWVPVVDEGFVILDSVDEMLDYATGMSIYNPTVLREGYVFRSLDGKQSFKAVSPEYLIHKK